jgi:dTMP kinase
MNEYSGLFITLEGIEGVGKSTCLKYIKKYLEKKNIPHVITREPGGTPLAEEMRSLLLHRYEEAIHPDTELLLLFAGRAQHLYQVIFPALKEGKWVISDRFTDASYAYQSGGRGIAEKKIALLENLVQENFRPNLVLLLDAPVKRALLRTSRRKQPDRIEREKEKFFHNVRRVYLERAHAQPRRYRIINASRPLSVVKRRIMQILDDWIVRHSPDKSTVIKSKEKENHAVK